MKYNSNNECLLNTSSCFLASDALLGTNTKTACSGRKVTTFMKQHMSSCYLKAETRHELHYILPFDEVKKVELLTVYSHCLSYCLSFLSPKATSPFHSLSRPYPPLL